MKKHYKLFFCKALILLITFSFLNFQEKAFAQTQISGKVKDIGNEPIPGVSVRLKGTTNGTTTDVNGEFKLSIPQNQGILVISSIGFTSKIPAVKTIPFKLKLLSNLYISCLFVIERLDKSHS